MLFAAGMSAMDTTDGVLMVKAYSWAFVNPVRKLFYNVTITGLSIAVALVIGTLEWLQVLRGGLHLHGKLSVWVDGVDFGLLGVVIVGLFAVAWAGSVAWWQLGKLEARYESAVLHAHGHVHSGGRQHVHQLFHRG